MTYDVPFSQAKQYLPKIWIRPSLAKPTLNRTNDITKLRFLHIGEDSILQRCILFNKKDYYDMSQSILISHKQEQEEDLQIGYKFADDYLDTKGLLLNLSSNFRYQIEAMKFGKFKAFVRATIRFILLKVFKKTEV